ncbi:MAG: ABC transporter permease [Chloroflexaceae bacterium]|nr:ABC transporter permease [Chloroflexaceae bacterium]
MNMVATITWLTFQEARRRRMVLIALVLGVLFLLLFTLGFALIDRELHADEVPEVMRRNFYNFLLMAGLYVVHFLTIMIAILASVDTVSGEITSHTIQTIAIRPLRRWQIIMGKWFGFAAMMVLYLGLLAGGMLLIVYGRTGYVPPNPLQGMALLVLEALVLIALSLLGGTQLSTMTNGVALFMLYGLAFIGAWVEQIGSLLQSGAAVRVGIITSLLMPVEALWRRTSYLMQPTLVQELGATPFVTSSVPSPAMVVYTVAYAGVALALAIVCFSRRDL